MKIEALMNDFATRSFRDIADQDYIAARLSYRYGLYSQFHWQSLQAIEKYLKAILLYNRTDINHNLECALKHTFRLKFVAANPPMILLITFPISVGSDTLKHLILFMVLRLWSSIKQYGRLDVTALLLIMISNYKMVK